MTKSALVLAAGLLGGAGVAARAFQAHGLIMLPDISQPRINDFTAGTQMILFHAVAMLALAGVADFVPRVARWTGILFTLGIVLFGSPLVSYGMTGTRSLMLLTPVGGTCLIAGWLLLAAGGGLTLARRGT